MNDDISIVQKDPVPFGHPFDAEGPDPLLLQRFANMLGDGDDLTAGTT